MTDRQVGDQVKDGGEGLEQLADKVERVQDAVEKLMDSGLKRRTSILLIADASGVGMRDVGFVLEGMEALASRFLESEVEE